LKSLAEKEEFDMDRVRFPKEADTDRVKEGCAADLAGVALAAAVVEPSREEEEPCRVRLAGSYMERVVVRLTEEVWVSARLPPRLDSTRSELVRCI
jgi:hypothetical protein